MCVWQRTESSNLSLTTTFETLAEMLGFLRFKPIETRLFTLVINTLQTVIFKIENGTWQLAVCYAGTYHCVPKRVVHL